MSPGSCFKQFDDCERFYDQRVRGKAFADNQERSFYLGYDAHLIADVTDLHFIRDEERVKAMWRRIRAVPELDEKARDCDETFDSAKRLVDKPRRNAAVVALENEYLYAHPETAYRTVLQTLQDFPSGFSDQGSDNTQNWRNGPRAGKIRGRVRTDLLYPRGDGPVCGGYLCGDHQADN